MSPVDDVSHPQLRVVASLSDLLDGAPPPAAIAIDIPVGLPDQVGPGGRGPEPAVRPLLGQRRSSMFSVPARAAIECTDYREACATALRTSDPPRQVSKQCFHLFPRIREVDTLLRECPDLITCVREVHPELAFWRLNGERSLKEPKKRRGRPHPPGLAERRAILIAAGIHASIVAASPPGGAGADDLLDALANLTIAQRLHRGLAEPFPNPPDHDAIGRPIAIWA